MSDDKPHIGKAPDSWTNKVGDLRGWHLQGRLPGIRDKGPRKEYDTPKKRLKSKIEKVVEETGIDPVEALYMIGIDETNPLDQRITALKECSQYLHAKKKVVDHKGSVGGPPTIQIVHYDYQGDTGVITDPHTTIDVSPRTLSDDEMERLDIQDDEEDEEDEEDGDE